MAMVIEFVPGMEVKVDGRIYKVGATWASTEIGGPVGEICGGLDHRCDSVRLFNDDGGTITINFNLPDDGKDKYRNPKVFREW